MGALQDKYETFCKNLNDLNLFKNLATHQKQINHIKNQISEYQKLNNVYHEQNRILKKEFSITKKRYDIDSGLLKEKVIAVIELDNSESILLKQERNVRTSEVAIINNTIQIGSLNREISSLSMECIIKEKELIALLYNSHKLLLSEINRWKEHYLFQAPFDGYISFNKFWSNDQFVKSGDEVLTVIPITNSIIGKIEIPIQRSGKVKIGQSVNIKVDNYPYQEYGMLEGKVVHISSIPSESNYHIDIVLTHGLTTTYKKSLEFKQEMQGDTEIITEDLRLIERLFYSFRSIFNH